MDNNRGKQSSMAALIAPLGLAAGLALGLSGAVNAQDYATSAGGPVVKNPFGTCWSMLGGAGQCGEKVEPQAMAPKDSDGDGVTDDKDHCPGTPKGVSVDANGCPLDSDNDGVPDYRDNCPGTKAGARVNDKGCEIIAHMSIKTTADHFAFDSADLKPAMKSQLDKVASAVKASKGDEHLTIIGHTDSTGNAAYNQNLSERRAQAAADYLQSQGVSASKLTVSGQGESNPVADNGTKEGRAANRRVEIRSQ